MIFQHFMKDFDNKGFLYTELIFKYHSQVFCQCLIIKLVISNSLFTPRSCHKFGT